jgi:hypothetical protein
MNLYEGQDGIICFGYTYEQKQIRNECYKKRMKVMNLVRNKEWDLIKECDECPNECTVCSFNTGNIKDHPMSCIFLFSQEFNLQAHKTIERIYGEMSKKKWTSSIIKYKPQFDKLYYFIQNNLIDINYSSEFTLLGLYSVYSSTFEWINIFEYFLSDEVGFNINLQDNNGNNILLTILYFDYNDNEDFYEVERLDKYIKISIEKLTYLLERGADPLLENKKGVCALEYARELKTFPQHQKEELIKLFERYI